MIAAVAVRRNMIILRPGTAILTVTMSIVSNQLDLYIVQANSDIGQSDCELSFGAFNYKDSTHEVIQDPGPSYEVSCAYSRQSKL